MTVTGVTRPVCENIICWVDNLNEDKFGRHLGIKIRVWLDTTDLFVRPAVHRAMLDAIMQNHFDERPYDLARQGSAHALPMAKEVARLLKGCSIQVNAVEVTMHGDGSIYYPEWP